MVNVWAGEPPGGGLFKEFLGEDVPLGPWNPGTLEPLVYTRATSAEFCYPIRE